VHRRDFGLAIAGRLRENGLQAAFDGRLNVLEFPTLRMRLRLLWSSFGSVGEAWSMRVERVDREVDFDLLVRMEDWYRPKDFFVVPPADVVVRFPQWLVERIPTELARFWCGSPQQLLERIRTLAER
jgi:hypothetical protein